MCSLDSSNEFIYEFIQRNHPTKSSNEHDLPHCTRLLFCFSCLNRLSSPFRSSVLCIMYHVSCIIPCVRGLRLRDDDDVVWRRLDRCVRKQAELMG